MKYLCLTFIKLHGVARISYTSWWGGGGGRGKECLGGDTAVKLQLCNRSGISFKDYTFFAKLSWLKITPTTGGDLAGDRERRKERGMGISSEGYISPLIGDALIDFQCSHSDFCSLRAIYSPPSSRFFTSPLLTLRRLASSVAAPGCKSGGNKEQRKMWGKRNFLAKCEL